MYYVQSQNDEWTQEDQGAAIEGPRDRLDCVSRLMVFINKTCGSLWCIPSPKQTPKEHLNRASRCNLV